MKTGICFNSYFQLTENWVSVSILVSKSSDIRGIGIVSKQKSWYRPSIQLINDRIVLAVLVFSHFDRVVVSGGQ